MMRDVRHDSSRPHGVYAPPPVLFVRPSTSLACIRLETIGRPSLPDPRPILLFAGGRGIGSLSANRVISGLRTVRNCSTGLWA